MVLVNWIFVLLKELFKSKHGFNNKGEQIVKFSVKFLESDTKVLVSLLTAKNIISIIEQKIGLVILIDIPKEIPKNNLDMCISFNQLK